MLQTAESLLGRVKDSTRRPWLERHVEDFFAKRTVAGGQPKIFLLTGEPGCGKTVVAAQLAADWKCLRYFIRTGSTDGVISNDVKSFFISLGLQLRRRYGSQIFDHHLVDVQASVKAGTVKQSGSIEGLNINEGFMSPFRQVLLKTNIDVEELEGTAVGIRIQELRDATYYMSAQQLAQDALITPLLNLSRTYPDQRVRIVIDALDESAEITSFIPLGDESPGNVDWLLTSRTGDHLFRFISVENSTEVSRLDLSEQDFISRCVEDAKQYALARLSCLPTVSAIADAVRSIAELADEVAEASGGNFLYLYHLINDIQAEAQAGNFNLLTSYYNPLPKGLDGVYRFFLTKHLIQAPETTDEWVLRYAPVLGVLAVAKDYLSSTQIAAFSGVDALYVDRIVGKLQQFLEINATSGDRFYAIYHGSFADYLLTQDHSRNPYPLRAEPTYHALIADYYQSYDESAWETCADGYALMYLPAHLRAVGHIERLCFLLCGAFGHRQSEVAGVARTRDDCEAACRAAASANRDDLLLRTLDFSTRIESDAQGQWESGRYVLSLLVPEPAVIMERAGHRGDSSFHGGEGRTLPWSGFLAAERLLDLGAREEALRLLRKVERQSWPHISAPKFINIGLGEGNALELALESELAGFLARCLRLDPGMTLDLVRRLFVDSNRFPNVRSAWRDVIRAFRRDAVSPPTAAQCWKVVETTMAWLRDGGNTLGWVGILNEVFNLTARAIPFAAPMPGRVVGALALAATARTQVMGSIHGAFDHPSGGLDDRGLPGKWAAAADVLSGLLEVRQALERHLYTLTAQGSSNEFLDLTGGAGASAPERAMWVSLIMKRVNEQLQQALDDLPSSAVPSAGSYGNRTEFLGRFSFILHRAGSQRWREYAEAALKMCTLDADMNDPPLGAVATCLSYLCLLPDNDIQQRAEAVAAHFNLASDVELAGAGHQAPAPISYERPVTLDSLPDISDLYERGRGVLKLYREGHVCVDELAAALERASLSDAANGQLPATSVPIPNSFSTELIKALLTAVECSPAMWAPEVARQLVARLPDGDSGVGRFIVANPRAFGLARVGDHDSLRKSVEAWWPTLGTDHKVDRMNCCLLAVVFDPDLAHRWYTELREELRDDERGTLLILATATLQTQRPERMDDLGPLWVADLPQPDSSGGIADYELTLCELWGPLDIFKPLVIAHMRRIAAALPRELVGGRPHTDADRTEGGDAETQEKGNVWRLIAGVIYAVGQVTILDDDSREAAGLVASAIKRALEEPSENNGRVEVRKFIDELFVAATAEGRWPSVQSGPIAEVLAGLYRRDTKGMTAGQLTGVDVMKFEYDRGAWSLMEQGLTAAAMLKKASPDWAETTYSAANRVWEELLVREPLYGRDGGWSEWLMDVARNSVDDMFRDGRERLLFQLTDRLAAWSLSDPPDVERLKEMQLRAKRVGDANVQSLLLASIATHWLFLSDIDRATRLARHLPPSSLAKVGFHRKLVAYILKQVGGSRAAVLLALKPLVLELILNTPLEERGHAFQNSLLAWLLLRADEETLDEGGGEETRGDYLKRLSAWALEAAGGAGADYEGRAYAS